MTARVAPVAAPVLVTDAPAMAGVLAAVLGLTPRQLRDLVREQALPHARRTRHIYVRVDVVLAAMGLGDVEQAPESSPRALTDADVLELDRARQRRRGSR